MVADLGGSEASSRSDFLSAFGMSSSTTRFSTNNFLCMQIKYIRHILKASQKPGKRMQLNSRNMPAHNSGIMSFTITN